MVKVSVVIPTKNAGESLAALMDSIREQAIPSIEIIVIDSGSTDCTVDIAKKKADTVLEIHPEEFHHGKTRNQGGNAATGEIIVFTVQDAIPASDTWLPNLVDPIKSGDANVTYGNQIAYEDAKPPDKFFYQYFYPSQKVILTEEDTRDQKEFYLGNIFLSDVSSAVSREVWEQIQFRDSVEMSEDKDFAYRVAKAGHTIQYCPEARIRHSHDYSLRELFTRRYKDGMAFSDIASEGSDEFINDGLKYMVSEFSYLIRNGSAKWIPYTLIYDFVYFISFSLGKNYETLPELMHQQLMD